MTESHHAPAIPPASGRETVPRLADVARRPPNRDASLARALDARRRLRPRAERFTHLKRMYD